MDRAALTRSVTYAQASLDGDVSLAALAAAANCSPPYFSRCFTQMMAESPKQYTLRLRLERAALRLVLLDDNILDIALDCGFTNHETFSRAFRRRFRVSPRTFRADGKLPKARQELPHSVAASTPEYLSRTVVRTLQPMSLAFIRHVGPYEQVPISTFEKLVDWARRHNVPEPYILLGIALDAPGITAPERLRFDAAIRVPREFRSEKLVGHQRFAGGLFALTTSVGPFTSLPTAYQEIFRRVQADKAFACEGVPCVEFYRVNRVTADLAIVHTEIGVPVRRRRLNSPT